MHLHAISQCLPIFAGQLFEVCMFLPSIEMLQNENPVVFQKFLDGLHVIRRTNQYWAGLGSDSVIEQTLMQSSLKSTGGLTRGSGMTPKRHLDLSAPYPQLTTMPCKNSVTQCTGQQPSLERTRIYWSCYCISEQRIARIFTLGLTYKEKPNM